MATLSGIIGAAFVLDAGTYLVSALLIYGMTVPAQDLVRVPFSVRAIWREMGEGWSYLTRQAELFWNTVISTVAQLAFGAEIVCSFIYAREVLDQSLPGLPGELRLDDERAGAGLRDRRPGDRRVRNPRAQGTDDDRGFVLLGAAMVGAGLVTNPYLAIGLFFLIGVANMLYLVPTITLFQERTPQRLFGRVVSTRQALTFGAMAISMGLAGWLTGIIGSARGADAGRRDDRDRRPRGNPDPRRPQRPLEAVDGYVHRGGGKHFTDALGALLAVAGRSDFRLTAAAPPT